MEPGQRTALDLLDTGEFARCLFNVSNDAVFIVDAESGQIEDVNPTAEGMLGVERSQLRGETTGSLLSENKPGMLEKMERACSSDGEFHSENGFTLTTASGAKVPVDLLVRRVPAKDRELAIIVVSDNGKQRRTEEQLLQLVAATAADTGSDFFSVLAHCLSRLLGVRAALILEIAGTGRDRLQTLGAWCEVGVPVFASCELDSIPCKRAIEDGSYFCDLGLNEAFPEDERVLVLGAVSYFGVGLCNSAGEPLGVLCVMDDKPMQDTEQLRSQVRAFSIRAASELERRSRERQVRHELDRFTLALQATTDGLWDFDVATRALWISPRILQLLGYDDELTNDPYGFWESHLHPDDRDSTLAALAAHINDVNHSFDVEYRLRHKDGTYRWYRERGDSIRDASGRAIRIAGSFRDVTDRKRVDSELEEQRSESVRLRNLLENALESILEGFALYDADDRLLMCNSRFRETYHLSADLLVPGAKFEDHIRTFAYRVQIADAVGREEEWIRERIAQHRNPHVSYIQELGNGRWISVSERPTADGGIVSVSSDITERKRAEQALRDSEEAHRVITESAMDSILTIDKQGVIVFANPATERIFGFTVNELLDQPLAILVSDPLKARHIDAMRRVAETENVLQGQALEVVGRHKDGRNISVEVSFGQHVQHGKRFYTGIVRDVSERKRVEEALKLREAELAHAGRLILLGDAVAQIAHEVNQPLFAISNYARAAQNELDREATATTELGDCFARIDRLATNAGEIIKGIRRFLAANEWQPQACAVNDVVRESIELVEFEADRSFTRIDFEPDANDTHVWGDHVQIQQVLVNLLRNALHAMEETEIDDRVIHLGLDVRDVKVEFSVRDSGPGFNQVIPISVIQSFQSSKPSGMGLGLVICRNIVETHGGEIWIGENAGNGAAFYFTLPRTEAHALDARLSAGRG